MTRLYFVVAALCLIGLTPCSLAIAAHGPNEVVQPLDAPTRDRLLADAAAQITKARVEATKDQPRNTKHFSGADQLAIHIWIRDAGADLRAKLGIALVEASDHGLPIDSNLTEASASLVLQLIEDQREDLATRLLASKVNMYWWCPLGSILQLLHLEGKSDGGFELLLDAHAKAAPSRQLEIEKLVEEMVRPYLPPAPRKPTGLALIEWTRAWYVPRKDRLVPNDEYCGGEVYSSDDPNFLELSTALERAISFSADRIALGGWRPAKYEPKSLLPDCLPMNARSEAPDASLHPLEEALQTEHTTARVVAIRSVDLCKDKWLLLDALLETTERGHYVASGKIEARFLVHVGNGRTFLLLPDQKKR